MSEVAVAEPGVEDAPPRALGSGSAQDRAGLRRVALRSRPRPNLLAAPLTALRGAGPKLAAAAGELGIASVGDLLAHVPHGYRERAPVREVTELRIGEQATVMVEVRSVGVRPTRRRNLRIVEATVADSSGPMKATWFNQSWLARRLAPGTRLLLNGRLDRHGFRVEAHEILGEQGGAQGIHTTGLVPVHPASERLRPNRIREWAWQAIDAARLAVDPLPAELRARRRLPAEADALLEVHFPGSRARAALARERLALEELILHQVALAASRSERRESRPGIAIGPGGGLVERWLASLPFAPTADQRVAFADLDADLASGRPMQRLLMGEVGSGKTVCALYAMLRALEAGHQAALMAPTETLAEQHAATVDRLLATEPIPFALLTGATPATRRRETMARLASGELGLVVGTHALIEPEVAFASLAVCVVDEQHRFGVSQRAALDAKGPGEAAPHVLHMTATPIPRTLSLTAYGDLDATTIRELPAGRRPVRTWVVGEEKREGAYEFIRERLREGRQAYVVCPLVADSEKLQAKAAGAEAERLRRGELAEFRVGLLHGQMSSREKSGAMEEFVAGRADVLVATTVIEVGIDVPNATVMLVEGAERYGLSQLHQLRGRVGRGAHPGHCILFADPDSELARRRMEAIARIGDGFELAEVDLTLRGEGEILGTRQHGLPRFRIADLPADAALLAEARREVRAMLRRLPTLTGPELEPLLDAARERFGGGDWIRA
ncbi:MAG: box helicase domain protein [Solirubrobacterales bacterium]|jgi:ATP-dependent DNA helicase RecG|nr:box helicase domain protein [Solirubrobacterales bacterium]